MNDLAQQVWSQASQPQCPLHQRTSCCRSVQRSRTGVTMLRARRNQLPVRPPGHVTSPAIVLSPCTFQSRPQARRGHRGGGCVQSSAKGDSRTETTPMHVYGPEGLAAFLALMLATSDTFVIVPVIVFEFVPGPVPPGSTEPECLNERAKLFRVRHLALLFLARHTIAPPSIKVCVCLGRERMSSAFRCCSIRTSKMKWPSGHTEPCVVECVPEVLAAMLRCAEVCCWLLANHCRCTCQPRQPRRARACCA